MSWRGFFVLPVLVMSLAARSLGQGAADDAPDLSGRWVMVQAMPALTALPIVGDIELTTITVALLDVEQSGLSVVLRASYCFTDLRMVPPLVESKVPDRFVTCLRPDPRSATLEFCPDGWRLIQGPVTEVRGARLVDPVGDLLPVDALDPRVFDQDDDGQPGLTVHVSLAGLITGDTYVIERLTFALDGLLSDPDTVAGSIEWTSEQHVVAASDALLVMTYEHRPHPDVSRHVFVMRRVSPDWTCETARERRDELLALVGW